MGGKTLAGSAAFGVLRVLQVYYMKRAGVGGGGVWGGGVNAAVFFMSVDLGRGAQ